MATLVSPRKAKKFFRAKREFTIGPVELASIIKRREDVNLIDMRKFEDYAVAHIPGAVNLPRSKWSSCAHLSREKLNIAYCYSEACRMAALAESDFAAHGYPIMQLEGGFEAWQFYKLPVETVHKARTPTRKLARKMTPAKPKPETANV